MKHTSTIFNNNLSKAASLMNTPCDVPVKGVTLRGEYTGYSYITKKHHFSLYNGQTVRLETLDGVIFNNVTTATV